MEVRHNEQRSRYELVDGDAVIGIADYYLNGTTAILPHTEIDVRRRGHGLGAVLVRATLDDMARRGLTVVPDCWYVAEFIDDNPAYRKLLAA